MQTEARPAQNKINFILSQKTQLTFRSQQRKLNSLICKFELVSKKNKTMNLLEFTKLFDDKNSKKACGEGP